MPIRRNRFVLALAASLVASTASAAYFHETKHDGFLWVSNPVLKRGFGFEKPVAVSFFPTAEASQITTLPPAPGLYEQDPGLRVPNGRCQGDDAATRSCELKWEAANLVKSKAVVSRSGTTLTVSPQSGAKLVLTDWEKCSAEGECDGERFTFLGPLKRSALVAIEIDYSHDSPSLLLFDTKTGKLAGVHYGSEPTFLNPAETLLVSSEDLNDATTMLVTRLDGDGPAIEVQCLGARTESSSFGVTFKRWVSDQAFEVVLLKSGQPMAARFERGEDGEWSGKSRDALKVEGFECRQRALPPKPTPAAAPAPAAH